MMHLIARAAALAVVLPATHAIASTPTPTHYVINASQSYVKAYVASWEQVPGLIEGLEDGQMLMTDSDISVPVNGDLSTDFHWELRWSFDTFGLSGSFDALIVDSPWDDERQRAYLSNAHLVTDAPDYSGFALPPMYAIWGQELLFEGGPCFDANFYSSSTSCTGFIMGSSRHDLGVLQGETMNVGGSLSGWTSVMGAAVQSMSDEPPFPIDYVQATNRYEYQMVATPAVPEPETYAMLLAGLGFVLVAARKRR